MSIQHPVFVRRIGDGPEGMVIVVTVMDAETLGLEDKDGDLFYLAQTTSSIYTGNNPSITIEKASKFSSEEYTEGVSKKTGDYHEKTIGNGIEGILRGPYWFIKKVKTVAEMMGM